MGWLIFWGIVGYITWQIAEAHRNQQFYRRLEEQYPLEEEL